MENLVQDPRLVATNNLKENNSIGSVIFQEHFPITPISASSQDQVEFVVPANSNGLIDLKGSYIVSGLALKVGGGADAPTSWLPTYTPSFKENIGDVLWKDVKIFINGVEVQDNHPNLYHHSAFYKRCLDDQGGNGTSTLYNAPRTQSVAALSTMLDPPHARYAGWKGVEGLDLAGDGEIGNQLLVPCDVSALPSHRAYGVYRRYEGNAGRNLNPLEVITKLQDGIFNQPFFFPPNCDIRILLTRSSNLQLTYSNTSGANEYTEIKSSILYIKRAYPIPSAMEQFNRSLALSPLVYNLKYTRIVQRSIPALTSSIQETNLLNGVVPDRVLVAFLPTLAMTGSYVVSPFISSGQNNLTLNNTITSIYVNANGRQYPQRQYSLPMGLGDKRINGARAYMDYVNAWAEDNDVFPQDSPPITFDNWCSNYTFFCFDLRNDKLNENGYTTDLNNRGSIEVLATQENGTALVATTMLVMGITNAKVFIDANRNVSKQGF